MVIKLLKNKIISLILIFALVISTIGIVSLYKPMNANAYTNPFTKSLYIYDLSTSNMQQKGRDTANQGGMIILCFGCPAYQNGTYGVQNWSAGFKSNSAVAQAVADFITGYNANSAHTNSIHIAVGTSNSMGSYIPSSWSTAGQKWINMIEGISFSGKISSIDGACDIELASGWEGPTTTRAWVDGFNNNRTKSTYMYDFGDNAGTYDNGAGMTYGTGDSPRNNGWLTSDVWYVSHGATCAWAMPQIYSNAMANEWYHVSLWAYSNNKGMYFYGLVSQDGLAGTLLADDSYNALKNQLAQNLNTTQSSFPYPTIMNN
jgi:hypothetical protein